MRHHRCVATYTAKIRKLHRPPVVIAVQIPRVSTKYHAKNSLFFFMCTCHHILHVRGLLFLFTNRPIILWFVSINKKVVTHAFDYVGVQQNWQKMRQYLKNSTGLQNYTTLYVVSAWYHPPQAPKILRKSHPPRGGFLTHRMRIPRGGKPLVSRLPNSIFTSIFFWQLYFLLSASLISEAWRKTALLH